MAKSNRLLVIIVLRPSIRGKQPKCDPLEQIVFRRPYRQNVAVRGSCSVTAKIALKTDALPGGTRFSAASSDNDCLGKRLSLRQIVTTAPFRARDRSRY